MAKANSANEENEYQHDCLVVNLRETLAKASVEPPFFQCTRIYEVPKKLRSVNEAAYTPQFVSIGPLHYGKKTLNNMQKYKFWYLHKFLERGIARAGFEDFVNTIEELQPRIRSCYSKRFDYLCSHEFVHMILVDAGFILELFLRYYFEEYREPNDPISYKPWLRTDIQQDLILLENQLPIFVLKKLYEMAFPPISRQNWLPSFCKLTCNYFFRHKNSIKQFTPSIKQAVHFTDLLRSFQLREIRGKKPIEPITDRPMSETDMSIRVYSFIPMPETAVSLPTYGIVTPQPEIFELKHNATELHGAGVKFKVSERKCFLDIDIKYSHGKLTIPCLTLDDNTVHFIRNLMALEQCHYPYETYICEYVNLMGSLINTDKDVDLLIEKKIIVNMLGDRISVADLFNKLCTHIFLSDPRYRLYAHDCEKLNEYYEVPNHKWKANLRHDYFNTPWRTASTIAAAILLLFALTNTICAIISVSR